MIPSNNTEGRSGILTYDRVCARVLVHVCVFNVLSMAYGVIMLIAQCACMIRGTVERPRQLTLTQLDTQLHNTLIECTIQLSHQNWFSYWINRLKCACVIYKYSNDKCDSFYPLFTSIVIMIHIEKRFDHASFYTFVRARTFLAFGFILNTWKSKWHTSMWPEGGGPSMYDSWLKLNSPFKTHILNNQIGRIWNYRQRIQFHCLTNT